jgi:hypothetical protein
MYFSAVLTKYLGYRGIPVKNNIHHTMVLALLVSNIWGKTPTRQNSTHEDTKNSATILSRLPFLLFFFIKIIRFKYTEP